MADERHLKALRLLEQNPEMTQRELAEALGVSVGAANYCLKALVGKGWVKLENFQKNPKKWEKTRRSVANIWPFT